MMRNALLILIISFSLARIGAAQTCLTPIPVELDSVVATSLDQTIAVEFTTGEVAVACQVIAFEGELTYDTTVVRLAPNPLTPGPLLAGWDTDIDDRKAGLLRFGGYVIGQWQGQGLLMRISFRTVGVGVSPLMLKFVYNEGQPATQVTSGLIEVRQNRPPVATAAALIVPEDGQLPVTLTGHDPDNDPLQFEIVSLPAHGMLLPAGAANTRLYQPAANFFGEDAFTFTVSDGRLRSEPATVKITVTPVNDAPIFTRALPDLEFDEKDSVTLNLADFVRDVDTPLARLGFTISAPPDTIYWRIVAGVAHLHCRVNIDRDIVASLIVTVADDSGATAKDRLLVTVKPDLAIEDQTEEAQAGRDWLGQNYPNPFNSHTALAFAIASPGRVRVRIYNAAGQLVRTLADDTFAKGRHQLIWDGTNDAGRRVISGVYFSAATLGGKEVKQKMTMRKDF